MELDDVDWIGVNDHAFALPDCADDDLDVDWIGVNAPACAHPDCADDDLDVDWIGVGAEAASEAAPASKKKKASFSAPRDRTDMEHEAICSRMREAKASKRNALLKAQLAKKK